MPNWCYNRLTVFGPHSQVTAFMAKARGNGQYYLMASYEVQWEEKRKLKDGDAYKTPEQRRLEVVDDFSFHALYPIPDSVMGKQYDPYGYDCEKLQWGIKWGQSDSKLVSFTSDLHKPSFVTYEYKTPWAPGELFLLKVSKDFPELTFALSYNEDYPTRGRLLINKGIASVRIHESPTARVRSSWGNLYYHKHKTWIKELYESTVKKSD